MYLKSERRVIDTLLTFGERLVRVGHVGNEHLIDSIRESQVDLRGLVRIQWFNQR